MTKKFGGLSWPAGLIALGAAIVGGLLIGALDDLGIGRKDALTADRMADLLENRDGGQVFVTIRELFPNEYQEFVAMAAKKANSGVSGTELSQFGFEFSSGLRRKNAEFAAGANEATIRDNIQSMLDITRALSDDPRTCAEYSAIGGSALLGKSLGPELVDLFIQNSQYAFGAIAEGRAASPAVYSEPTDEHWVEFFGQWRMRGVNDDELGLFFANDPSDPRMCDISIRFLEAVVATPGESGSAIRMFLVIEALKN